MHHSDHICHINFAPVANNNAAPQWTTMVSFARRPRPSPSILSSTTPKRRMNSWLGCTDCPAGIQIQDHDLEAERANNVTTEKMSYNFMRICNTYCHTTTPPRTTTDHHHAFTSTRYTFFLVCHTPCSRRSQNKMYQQLCETSVIKTPSRLQDILL